eukprot:TRINITY_DN110844_c0_g1_i1.p1 TRINITY_DN110844_c0_g1~~TRINITY_DN110844_c0_g1_i1.p1  ORF type:complete len:818 (+),score=292.40 TRINITY_DN110844_c0_g1_i1:134-2587(+)
MMMMAAEPISTTSSVDLSMAMPSVSSMVPPGTEAFHGSTHLLDSMNKASPPLFGESTSPAASSIAHCSSPGRPGLSRPYCPSRYQDGGMDHCTQSPPDKAAQLRAQIRALQERRSSQHPAWTCTGDVDARSPEGRLVGQADVVQDGVRGSLPSQTPEPRNSSILSWDGPADGLSTPAKSCGSSSLPAGWPSKLKLQQVARQQGFPSASTARTQEPSDKLSSILSFLDEVDETTKGEFSSIVSSARSSRGPWEDSSRRVGRPVVEQHGLASLQSRVAVLEVEVQDKKSIIETLKKALGDARGCEKSTAQDVAREWEEKLQKQKSHYEGGLERHLKLVDRLLQDKTELTKRCELFTEELKAVERKYQMKIEEMDEQAGKDVARQKQNWVAAEKLRREAWEKEKVKEIKEMTVKGLTPEVERILAERKQEKAKLEERHREAVEQLRRELLEQSEAQARDLREQLLREQERALEQEREAHRRKLREEFEKFNAQLQEERAKCAGDLLAERRRGEQAQQEASDVFDSRLREALFGERQKADGKLREMESQLRDAEDKHSSELDTLRRQHRLDLDGKLEEERARCSEEAEQARVTLREELVRERDRQLDVLMERVSREQVEEQRKWKQSTQAQVDAAKKEAEASAKLQTSELEEVRIERERSAAEASLLRQRVSELEGSLERETKLREQREDQARQTEIERATLQQEVGKGSEQHREELWNLREVHHRELERMREELKKAEQQAAQERACAQAQWAEGKCREEQIVSELEARIKRSLQAKDEAATELRARCGAAENKVRELEYLLARQREELLGSLTKDFRSK